MVITLYFIDNIILGGQMRLVICYMSLLITSSMLVACGQTGALQLPNDPNYDKRAKYLIYPDAKVPTSKEQKSVESVQPLVNTPASEVLPSKPSTQTP